MYGRTGDPSGLCYRPPANYPYHRNNYNNNYYNNYRGGNNNNNNYRGGNNSYRGGNNTVNINTGNNNNNNRPGNSSGYNKPGNGNNNNNNNRPGNGNNNGYNKPGNGNNSNAGNNRPGETTTAAAAGITNPVTMAGIRVRRRTMPTPTGRRTAAMRNRRGRKPGAGAAGWLAISPVRAAVTRHRQDRRNRSPLRLRPGKRRLSQAGAVG